MTGQRSMLDGQLRIHSNWDDSFSLHVGAVRAVGRSSFTTQQAWHRNLGPRPMQRAESSTVFCQQPQHRKSSGEESRPLKLQTVPAALTSWNRVREHDKSAFLRIVASSPSSGV